MGMNRIDSFTFFECETLIVGGNSGDSHYSDLEYVNLRFAHCCLATAEAVSLDSETLEHGQVEI